MKASTVVRVSAGALLLAERKTRTQLVADMRDSVANAAAQAKDRRTKGAILALLLTSSHQMSSKLRQTIVTRRQAARVAAIVRLRRELVVAGIGSAALANLGNGSARAPDDDAYGQSAADALAIAWRGLAMAQVIRAFHRDEDASDAIANTATAMTHRVLRTAATENAQAYSDEHRAALEDATEFDKAYGDGTFAEDVSGVVRQWSAILDTRTCPQCAALDGETADIGGSFKSGYEPGFVHPLCRCIDVYVPRSQAIKEAA